MKIQSALMSDFSALRRHAGVSIPELASQLGFTEAQIVDWDNGRTAAPKHVLHVLDYMSEGIPQSQPEPQQHSFPWSPDETKQDKRDTRTGSFTDNMRLPIHRWFRYSAGFSADWVRGLIKNTDGLLFDPFAGSGTSLLAAQSAGLPSAGAESHPFVAKLARAKLGWHVDAGTLIRRADQLLSRAKAKTIPDEAAPLLLSKCFTPDALQALDKLRFAFADEPDDDSITHLLWLAITSVLRECSGVGTAQWQYVLPNKSKAKVSEPFGAFQRRILMFSADIAQRAASIPRGNIHMFLHQDDARTLSKFANLKGQVTSVVTSPPYPNNYDYADATRLEMTFWREVGGWSDLQHTVRHKLIRSCSQHTAAERLTLEALIETDVVAPIRDELAAVCRELERVRETKGGRKTYHTMVAAYFKDLADVWNALRPLCAKGAKVCFVVGDSAPYGVHVPAERWLERLAIAAGFYDPRFEKIRDRNLKWKNRKHRVPLKEGNLWLEG